MKETEELRVLRRWLRCQVVGGMTLMNPSIRKLYRPLLGKILPASLTDRLLMAFTEVGRGRMEVVTKY